MLYNIGKIGVDIGVYQFVWYYGQLIVELGLLMVNCLMMIIIILLLVWIYVNKGVEFQ